MGGKGGKPYDLSDDFPVERKRSRQNQSAADPGSGTGGMDPESEINRNRDFYRSQDVRPPFTYAALIRQVN